MRINATAACAGSILKSLTVRKIWLREDFGEGQPAVAYREMQLSLSQTVARLKKNPAASAATGRQRMKSCDNDLPMFSYCTFVEIDLEKVSRVIVVLNTIKTSY